LDHLFGVCRRHNTGVAPHSSWHAAPRQNPNNRSSSVGRRMRHSLSPDNPQSLLPAQLSACCARYCGWGLTNCLMPGSAASWALGQRALRVFALQMRLVFAAARYFIPLPSTHNVDIESLLHDIPADSSQQPPLPAACGNLLPCTEFCGIQKNSKQHRSNDVQKRQGQHSTGARTESQMRTADNRNNGPVRANAEPLGVLGMRMRRRGAQQQQHAASTRRTGSYCTRVLSGWSILGP